MKRFSIIIFILGFWLVCKAEIVINEVFYDALGCDDANEWIELYNNGIEDVELEGWVIQAGGTSFSDVYSFSSITIRTEAFFLVSEFPHPLANIVTNLGFENGGSATDGIRIINPATQYTDTVLYDFPNTNNLLGDSLNQLPCINPNSGYSLARNNDGFDSDSSDDWFSCAYISPGTSNIIEKIVSLQDCKAITNGTIIDISTVILNLSTYDVDNSELSIKILFNNELKHFDDLTNISSCDSLNYCTAIDNEFLESGLLEVELIGNSNITIVDNLWEKWINYQSPRLALSEIMYYPLTNQAEWIEVKLLNDVTNAKISLFDASGNEATSEISGFTGNYIVITEDKNSLMNYFTNSDSLKVFQAESWTHLNNTGDLVLLKFLNTTLDSLNYKANSTPTGYSWERNEVNNEWARCNSVLGATPTEINSISQNNPSLCSNGLKIINKLISIKKEKQLIIQFNFEKLVNSLDIQLFDLRGREISTITTYFSNQYSGEFCWDGYLKGKYLPSGLYPLIIKFKAENGRLLEEKKIIITINR